MTQAMLARMFLPHRCYDGCEHDLASCSEIANNWSVSESMVDELVREARAALRAEAVAKKHRDRVKELLPVVRAEDVDEYGPAKLEELIGKLYDRGTISRLTAEHVGRSKKKPAES